MVNITVTCLYEILGKLPPESNTTTRDYLDMDRRGNERLPNDLSRPRQQGDLHIFRASGCERHEDVGKSDAAEHGTRYGVLRINASGRFIAWQT
jgi:hypothetical protein